MMRTGIRRILAAVEFTESLNAVFDRALALARVWSAELYVLDASSPRFHARFPLSGNDVDVERSDVELSQLRRLVQSARAQGVRVQVLTTTGDPAHAVAAQAHLVMADLIVVPQDLGSSRVWSTARVAAAIARSAPVPVLIVPAQTDAPHRAALPFGQIVVAVDFTVASAVALRVTTDLIDQAHARATIVHALSFASPLTFSGGEALGVVDDVRDRTAAAETRLRGVIPARARHRVRTRVLTGSAGQAILDAAAEVDADLVVMGVPRRTRLGELFFGSTFRQIVRRSLRPILAIPVAAGAYRWTGEPVARSTSEGYPRVA